MKCPKCGYNSFDHLDSCKKCGKDLVGFKQQFGIKSILFPGQMKHQTAPAEIPPENATVEETIAVTAAAATAAAAAPVVAEAPDLPPAGGGDDFGFDFMGDSEGEEDLSFDELFEEAPADEDVEESLPGPKNQPGMVATDDDFAFDPELDEVTGVALPVEDELADDFGFDIDDEAEGESAKKLLSAEDDDFRFQDDRDIIEDRSAGTKEDPKNPFEVPGSSQKEEIPEQTMYFFEPPLVAPEVEQPPAFPPAALIASLDEPESPSAPPAEPAESVAGKPVQEAAEWQTGPVEPAANPVPAEAIETAGDPAPVGEQQTETAPIGLAVAGEIITEERILLAEQLPPEESWLLPPVAGRIGAFVCDLLLLLLVGTSFVVAAEATMSDGGEGFFPSLETLLDLSIPYFLVLFSLAFGYFTLFHFLTGQTPGKMLAGLRVETLNGDPLAFSQAFLRSVGGLLQLLPIGLGYLAILSNASRRGWNDQLAGTRLVNLKESPDNP
jgi:uncharacterized RDD family membrane protein YckC